MPAPTRTQRNLRLSDEETEGIDELRSRGPRGIPRERYLRAIIVRHLLDHGDEATFDAFAYVQGAESPERRDRRLRLLRRLDERRGELSRLAFVERAVSRDLGLGGDVFADELRETLDDVRAYTVELEEADDFPPGGRALGDHFERVLTRAIVGQPNSRREVDSLIEAFEQGAEWRIANQGSDRHAERRARYLDVLTRLAAHTASSGNSQG